MKLTLCWNRLTILLVCSGVFAGDARAELRVPHSRITVSFDVPIHPIHGG